MKDQREQRVTEITDMADNHYGRTNDASACFGIVQPPSLPPCSGCKIVPVRTKIRLWLILDKHFIAKPARTTSLPRFLSDTIYEMGTRLMRFQSPHLSASRTHEGAQWDSCAPSSQASQTRSRRWETAPVNEAQHPGSERSRRPGVKLSQACRASSLP